jgi:hypothetical protein
MVISLCYCGNTACVVIHYGDIMEIMIDINLYYGAMWILMDNIGIVMDSIGILMDVKIHDMDNSDISYNL